MLILEELDSTNILNVLEILNLSGAGRLCNHWLFTRLCNHGDLSVVTEQSKDD